MRGPQGYPTAGSRREPRSRPWKGFTAIRDVRNAPIGDLAVREPLARQAGASYPRTMDEIAPTDRDTAKPPHTPREPLAARLVHDATKPVRVAILVGVACAVLSLAGALVSYLALGISANDLPTRLVMYVMPALLPLLIAPVVVLQLLRVAGALHQRTRELEHEVERRRQAEEKLAKLATVDDLTQVVNRRAFFARAAELADTADAACVAVLDLDNFKGLNDTYGHAAGDDALRRVGELLIGSLEAVDVVGRLGGEEFGMILTGKQSCETALAVAERIRSRTAALGSGLTASIGLTDWAVPDDTIDAALARADAALYRAKQRGRNRVEVIRRGDELGALSDLSPVARR